MTTTADPDPRLGGVHRDVLSAMLRLHRGGVTPDTERVAETVDATPDGTARALRVLEGIGYVEPLPYYGWQLTSAGHLVAGALLKAAAARSVARPESQVGDLDEWARATQPRKDQP